MLGAGLIKLRGDACWRDLTCLDYHYETQPIPNPLSAGACTSLPRWFHRLGVLFNHVAELVAPWFVFGPRRCAASWPACSWSRFQVDPDPERQPLVPELADDRPGRSPASTTRSRAACFPRALVTRAPRSGRDARAPSRAQRPSPWRSPLLIALPQHRARCEPALAAPGDEHVVRSARPRQHATAPSAASAASATRSCSRGRATTRSATRRAGSAYEFPCKPGDLDRRPCVIAPYQPRLDWQIWFAAMSTPKARRGSSTWCGSSCTMIPAL